MLGYQIDFNMFIAALNRCQMFGINNFATLTAVSEGLAACSLQVSRWCLCLLCHSKLLSSPSNITRDRQCPSEMVSRQQRGFFSPAVSKSLHLLLSYFLQSCICIIYWPFTHWVSFFTPPSEKGSLQSVRKTLRNIFTSKSRQTEGQSQVCLHVSLHV